MPHAPESTTQRTHWKWPGMGLRAKILLIFLFGLGSVGGLTLLVLQERMRQSFDAMEQRTMEREAVRVLKILETAADGLLHQTRDWAEWTDMHNFLRAPQSRQSWVADNLNTAALNTADLSVVAVLDAQQRVVLHLELPGPHPPLGLSDDVLNAHADTLRGAGSQARCAVVESAAGAALLCWARITRSDLSGDFVGILMAGRLLQGRRLVQWQEQTGATLRWAKKGQPQGHTQTWKHTLPPGTLSNHNIHTRKEAQDFLLYLPVYDHRHQVALELEIRLPRTLKESAALLQREVLQAAALSAAAMALILGVFLHLLLVRRLRIFSHEMVQLGRSHQWSQRISTHSRDELGILAREVNKVLALVESQVENLTALSMTDSLTGLPNRRAFDARLALEFGRSQRLKQPLPLLLIDVDYFKRYNDRYGHPAGDLALQAVAAVLRQACARATDLTARTGGEEFAVLLPDTSTQAAISLALRIQRLLQERQLAHADSAASPWLTVSIGIAAAGMADESPQALIDRADRALYTAKAQGRNRYHCDDSALPPIECAAVP